MGKVTQHKKPGPGSTSPWNVLDLRVLWDNQTDITAGYAAWNCRGCSAGACSGEYLGQRRRL